MTTAQVKPAIRAYLDTLYGQVVPAAVAAGFEPNVINAREALAVLTAAYHAAPATPVAEVRDATIPASDGGYDLPVRIFSAEPDAELPVLVYLHGGGHMAGSVTVYDPILRGLAVRTRHVVVAPEYRLAPECPYPAGEQDAATAIAGVLATLDARGVRHSGRVSIAGDSAGGALCTAYVRDHQDDPDFAVHRQLLLYPSVDYTMEQPSITENGAGYLLDTPRIAWYFDNYFRHGEDRRAVSPLYGRFSDRMPPTLLVVAGFDPLRDEDLAYADAMRAAGADVEVMRMPTMIHAFMNMGDLAREEVDAVYDRADAFLNA